MSTPETSPPETQYRWAAKVGGRWHYGIGFESIGLAQRDFNTFKKNTPPEIIGMITECRFERITVTLDAILGS